VKYVAGILVAIALFACDARPCKQSHTETQLLLFPMNDGNMMLLPSTTEVCDKR
jgi:hypothetical protein